MATPTNRRRLRVFVATLIVALGVSFAYTWLRPAEYRASARLDITPGSGSMPAASAVPPADEPMRPFLTEVQVLTSRPVLEETVRRLRQSGEDLSLFGPDAVAAIQSHIRASPVADTHVVELVAIGERASLLAPLANTVVEVYQTRLAEAYRNATTETVLRADDEVRKLEQTVVAKRREVEGFRVRNNIVSLERDENDILARVRNQSTSLSAADDKVAAAQGKLLALNEAAANGEGARSRGDSAVASLESRVAQMREEQRDLERGFTQEYLAKDPKVVAQRARLAELERQLVDVRASSQQVALADARDDLASAQATAARLRQQMSSSRQEVAHFTARFNEYKSMQGELEELEKAQREALQRRAKLEASEQARMPSVRVLEAATTPDAPWRPLYWRDTAISIGGSLVLALIAMWLVELFNRPEPQPSVVLIQPPTGALRYDGPQALTLGDKSAAVPRVVVADPALLPQPPRFPRELHEEEVAALVRAADSGPRLAMLLLLSGLNSDELLALRWRDVDTDCSVIRIHGDSPRDVPVATPLGELLRASRAGAEADAFVAGGSRPPTRDAVDAQILCAAHDAGIDQPMQVNAASLRHTYLAFLVRQGIRFADLTRLVGPLQAEVVGAYSTLSPHGMRTAKPHVDLLHPALHDTGP
jgi:uncharacterized protein involved in exopolysaccharide biosynthesis